MQLNIKNGDAYEKARELATLTGESLTEAVTKAIDARLEKHRRKHARASEEKHRDIKKLLAEIDAIPDIDPTFTEDDLYDEYGLPK